RATANDAFDTVPGHKIQAACCSTLNGLPALHRAPQRTRYQREFGEFIAPIRHPGRQGIIGALVRERLVVECFEDNIDLFFEQISVGGLVEQWRPEGLHLTRMIPL